MKNRIWQFHNGTAIDLKKVNSIGSFDKETNGNIIIPVYYERSTKPVKYIVGHAMGEIPEDKKKKIFIVFQTLLNAWANYLNQ